MTNFEFGFGSIFFFFFFAMYKFCSSILNFRLIKFMEKIKIKNDGVTSGYHLISSFTIVVFKSMISRKDFMKAINLHCIRHYHLFLHETHSRRDRDKTLSSTVFFASKKSLRSNKCANKNHTRTYLFLISSL